MSTSSKSLKIAILAKGPSLMNFHGEFDEVWGLNQIGQTHELDRLFVMDDLRHRMPAWDPELPEWLKTYDKPIITSTVYPEWPTAVAFPLREVCREHGWPLGLAYYSTTDYMLAFAIHRGVREIHTFGVDCNFPTREERPRVSTAMWIGIAMSRGIKVTAPQESFFRWYCHPGVAYEHGLYGYVGPPRPEELYDPVSAPHWDPHSG